MLKGHKSSLLLVPAILLGTIINTTNNINSVYAEAATTDFSITVNSSLSLRVSSSSVGFDITPSKTGVYDSASFNVYSSTNNTTGYTLTMSTESVDLVSNTVNPTTGENPTIPTLEETADGISASTFESTTDSTILNHYGVSIAGYNYNAMKEEQEIKKTEVNNAAEDTTIISLASKLDLNTVPGVYSTTINFQLVVNPQTPAVPFISSDTDLTKSTVHPCAKMGDLECEDTDEDGIADSLVFPANSLLRTYEIAYTDAGKPMYVEDANADIGWRPMTDADLPTIGGKEVRFAMQDISKTLDGTANGTKVCDAAAPGTLNGPGAITYVDEALVMDLRDGKSYWIAKQADSRCWMTQNLDLDLSTSKALSSETSDITYFGDKGYDIANGYSKNDSTNVISWTPLKSTIQPTSISSSGNTISGYETGDTIPMSVNVGEWYWIGNSNGTWYNSSSNDYLNIDNNGAGDKFKQSQYSGNKLHGHVGNYYNWTAAVASNNTSSFSSSTYGAPSNNPQNSICPAGWRLPIIARYTEGQTGDNEIYNLAYTYSMTARTDYFLTANPIWLVRGGYLLGDGLHSSGYGGYYWSSTVNLESSAFHLTMESAYLGPADAQHRSSGFPVRCIAK